MRIAKPPTEIQSTDQRRNSRRDVDNCASGEIECREPAAQGGI